MKRNLIAMLVLATGTLFAQSRDGYGQPGYGGGNNSPRYDDRDYRDDRDGYDYQGYDAPAPPPAPRYAYGYRRPPMPGPGFVWIDGYWSFMRGRYVWETGYWTRPPYMGGYWSAPRYNSGRFFGGFWSGGRGGGGSYGRYDNHRGGNSRGYRR